jgi:hypothetical protein
LDVVTTSDAPAPTSTDLSSAGGAGAHGGSKEACQHLRGKAPVKGIINLDATISLEEKVLSEDTS